jgi:hypothetical protein
MARKSEVIGGTAEIGGAGLDDDQRASDRTQKGGQFVRDFHFPMGRTARLVERRL